MTSGDQTLDWDIEGRLSKVTEAGKTTSYIYDAGGTRLLRKDPTGTTLYLAGQEIRLDTASGKRTGTRYYSFGNGAVAMRIATSSVPNISELTWLAGDHQGTAQIAIKAASMAVTQRRQTPFGAPRGPGVAFPGEKGFVGGTIDPSIGLTTLGARQYDPTTGRFISVDPVLDLADPQAWNGYAYSNNSPITFSDPSGLWLIGGEEDDTYKQYGVSYGSGGSTTYIGNKKSTTEGYRTNRISGSKCRGRGGCGHRDQWKAENTPKTNDGKQLKYAFADYAGTDFSADLAPGNYWSPKMGDDAVCFGRIGCAKAYSHLLLNPDDVDGAKFIAATYCLDNFEECDRHARSYERSEFVTNLVQEAVFEIVSRGMAPKLSKTGCSFSPGTKVLMADGTQKPIEEVQTGDIVLATDPETGHTEPEVVLAPLSSEGVKNLVEITVETDGKASNLVATDNHPFWAPDLRKWITAGELRAGSLLQTSTGVSVQVTAVHRRTVHQRVYNLSVDDLHTFYALAGVVALLVHNNNCGDLGPSWRPQPTSKICDSNGCEAVALDIQKRIGGDIYRINIPDPVNMTNLGRYRGEWTMWGHHEVVVLEGRVYDGFTGRTGVSVDEYKALWTDLLPSEFPF